MPTANRDESGEPSGNGNGSPAEMASVATESSKAGGGEELSTQPQAQPDRQAKRQMIAIRELPELRKRVAEIEKKLGLETELEHPPDSTKS